MKSFFKYFPYKDLDHTLILLYGFHLSFFIVFSVSILPDYFLESPVGFYIDFISAIATVLSYYLLHYKNKVLAAKIIIVSLSLLSVFGLIYINHSNHLDAIYIILLPIVTFYLFKLKEAIVISSIIYSFLLGLLYYIYLINPEDFLYSDSYILINFFLATIMVFIFGVFYHLGVESSFLKLQASNRQKDILLKEVHHRVKNNLNVTASMIGLQAMRESKEVKEQLIKSKSRIEAIAIVHEMLYKQDDFSQIIFNEYVKKLDQLVVSLFCANNHVSIKLEENNGLTLSLDTMIQLGIMINEMLINTFKHAKHDALCINISLKKEQKNYVLNYKDNGKNKVDTAKLLDSKGLGMKLIQLNVKQLHSKVDIKYNNGLSYEMRFKDATNSNS